MHLFCCLTHSHKMTPFDVTGKEAFSKHYGTRRNAGDQHFLLFPQCYVLYQRQRLTFILLSANAFNWSNFCCLGMGSGKLCITANSSCLVQCFQ